MGTALAPQIAVIRHAVFQVAQDGLFIFHDLSGFRVIPEQPVPGAPLLKPDLYLFMEPSVTGTPVADQQVQDILLPARQAGAQRPPGRQEGILHCLGAVLARGQARGKLQPHKPAHQPVHPRGKPDPEPVLLQRPPECPVPFFLVQLPGNDADRFLSRFLQQPEVPDLLHGFPAVSFIFRTPRRACPPRSPRVVPAGTSGTSGPAG